MPRTLFTRSPILRSGLIALAFFGGCSRRDSQSVTPIKPPTLKTVLDEVSASGNLEDVKETISTQLEKLEESDAVKAQELITDFEVLRKATTPAQVKEQAKKMAAKL